MSPAGIRELRVWANGQPLGTWRLPSRGRMEFQYDDAWLAAPESRPLSISLPLPISNVPYTGKRGRGLLRQPAARQRAHPAPHCRNAFRPPRAVPFDLLAAIGRDCVGAVQILPADETPAEHRQDRSASHCRTPTSRPSSAGSRHPNALVRDDEEFRISIAGAQEKTAFLKHHGRWCRPVGSTPTTHIFKLPLGLVGNRQADMRTSVENEWLCARIVAAFGIRGRELRDRRVRLAQGAHRRAIRPAAAFQRQATGCASCRRILRRRRARPGTRSTRRTAGRASRSWRDILRGSIEAQRDLETLFKAQLLFFLLAATDGHAKNFSIRILAGGRFQLTPLYDVLSAWPVIGKKANEIPLEKAKLAMALPGERPRTTSRPSSGGTSRRWERSSASAPRPATLIDEMLAKTATVIAEVQRELPRGFPQGLAERIFTGMGRAAKLLGGPEMIGAITNARETSRFASCDSKLQGKETPIRCGTFCACIESDIRRSPRARSHAPSLPSERAAAQSSSQTAADAPATARRAAIPAR